MLWFGITALPAAAEGQNWTSDEIADLVAEANGGSLDAKMRLGLANDLGWGMPIDKTEALRWYQEAAEAGDPEGQFNVAVMFDAGLDTQARDPVSAAIWYTRAAANGVARAQYNLGLMYQTGDGIEQNTDLALFWFDQAAKSLPAAKQKLVEVAPAAVESRKFAPPRALFGDAVSIGGGQFAELVWTAPPGPVETQYAVEIVGWDVHTRSWSAPFFAEETLASGVVSNVLPDFPIYAWRVSRIDPNSKDYAATPWHQFGSSPAQVLPENALPLALTKTPTRPEVVARELLKQILK